MTQVASLNIAVDTTGLRAGQAELNSLASTGDKTARRVDAASTSMASDFTRTGRAARAMGTQMQGGTAQTANLAAQFNDIGVMLAAGQNPMQLALQQGTQINQVFAQMGGGANAVRALGPAIMSMINPMSLATIGIIAGGAALVQWASKAMGASEEAKKLAEAVLEIAENAETAATALREARLGVSAEELQAMDALAGKTAEILFLRADMEGMSNRQLRNARAVLANLTEEQSALQSNLDIIQEAQNKVRLYEKGLDDAALAALELSGVDLSSNISDAAIDAARLASNLGISLNAAREIAFMQETQNRYSGRGADPRSFDTEGRLGGGFVASGELVAQADAILNPPKTRSSGGGGGQSEAEKARQQLMREAEALFKSTRTEAEKYAGELERLEQIRSAGLISGDTYIRALEGIEDKYNDLGDAAKFWEDQQAMLKDGLLDAITSGGDLTETFNSLAKSIAKAALEAALFNSGPLSGGMSGAGLLGGIGSLFSFDGGGYTGNAPRAGGLDGKGGFLAMMHPQETVTDHTKGGGGGNNIVNVNIATEPGLEASATESQSGGVRQLEIQVRRIVAGDIQSGGAVHQSIRKTFGASPALAGRG